MPSGISDRAAVFLNTVDSPPVSFDPSTLGTRLDVNPAVPLEFENEFFVGRVVILHRVPSDYHGSNRYKDFFTGKKRRWELRWQGKFKEPLDEKIVFGAEISAGISPRLNFASRAFLSILFKFSQSLARSRGADLYTNMVSELGGEGTKFFYFPVHTSDLILSTPGDETPPDICALNGVAAGGPHVQCNGLFKNPSALDRDHTYTFVFYSMYLDFLSWDIQNVPIGLNGMSLTRLAGNQPVSVVMKTQQTKPGNSTTFFRLLVANRCISPDWSCYLSTGEKFNPCGISEFFSVMSSFDSNDDNMGKRPSGQARSSRGGFSTGSSVWSGFKRIFFAPSRFLASCLRAPVSFAVDSESRMTPVGPRRTNKSERIRTGSCSQAGGFLSPRISEEVE